jgi:hypothetical protein
MMKSDQKAAAQQAGFHFITALTKSQIRKLLAQQVLQMELFEENVGEVHGGDGRRYILRRNPLRQQELAQGREQKRQAVETAVQKANRYLDAHPRAQVRTHRRKLAAKIEQLNIAPWLKLSVRQQRLVVSVDEPALQQAAQLDGCYVVETDLPATQAGAQIIHDRYCALEEIERDFRTLKTGHLEWRPWFVVTEENTQAHALTAMLALKVRRHLERAWRSLEVTVEEGLHALEELCVMELVHAESGQIIARQVPEPSPRQQSLLDALGLHLPSLAPVAHVQVGTRKKIQQERKPL